jgi:hypothetical protein
LCGWKGLVLLEVAVRALHPTASRIYFDAKKAAGKT